MATILYGRGDLIATMLDVHRWLRTQIATTPPIPLPMLLLGTSHLS